MRQLASENLSHEYIRLVPDSAAEAVDGNDVWYKAPITPAAKLRPVVGELLDGQLLDPVVLVIVDPAIDKATIDYLAKILKRLCHTKTTVIMLFLTFTREINPSSVTTSA